MRGISRFSRPARANGARRLAVALLASVLVAAGASVGVPAPARAQSVQLFNWDSVNIRGMGYVTGLVIQPSSGDVYVRTDVGGVYRYDRGAEKWLPLMDRFDQSEAGNLDIESVAADPGTNGRASRVYAAMLWSNGANPNDSSVYRRSGEVMVSDDRGANWRPTGLRTQNLFLAGNGEYRVESGERLGVDPATGNVVLLGTRKNGLWRGVRDGSGNYAWSQVTSGLPNPTGLYDYAASTPIGFSFVAWDPSSSGRVYVGVNGGGVYVSTDNGQSFSLSSGGPTYPLRGAVANDGTLYVTSGTYGYGSVGRQGSVWRLRSGGWTNVTPGNQDSPYSGITVQGNNSNVVLVGRDNVVWRSTSGGNGGTWSSQTMNLRAPNAGAPGYFTNDEAGVSGGLAAMAVDPSDANKVWWTNGWGVTRTDAISAFPSAVWNWRMNNLEELVVRQVRVPNKPKASGGADLISAVADVMGYVHPSADAVPGYKHNPDGIKLPYPSTSDPNDASSFSNFWSWMYATWPGGFFPNPMPHVAGFTSIDAAYNAPDHQAAVGFHQFASIWPLHGYSTNGGQTWQAFGSVPAQTDSYVDGGGVTRTQTFLASGGAVALGSAVPSGASRCRMVWVPAAATFGNPWWNTTNNYMDARIPWPHYSADGGNTWNVCRLANASQRPSISLGANTGSGGVWSQHVDDLPKGWGNLITPWFPSRCVAAPPSDTTGQTFYYFCNNGPQAGGEVWGVFYKSTDGGQTWTKGQEGIFPSYCVRVVMVVNPTNANDIWISFQKNSDTINGNRLFRSTNGGANFSPVSTVNSADSVTFGKGQNGTPAVYVFGRVGGATKDAFYRSDDLGGTWTRISDFGNLTVRDIEADPRTYGILYAGTNGRGILRGRVAATGPRYDFESATQGWGAAWGNVGTVTTSTTQKFTGSRSLSVALNNATAGQNTTGVRVLNGAGPLPGAGQTVTARVWIPSGAPITRVYLFSQGAGWNGWYSNQITPTLGGWTTIQMTLPANANVPLNSLGISFDLSAAWSGTVYVDSVTW
jgi:xyloglucan-specific exo-beta-1,4-glucanase